MPPGVDDRDRPLAESGQRDARAIAQKMQQDNLRPDMILCSPARRTRETCEPVRNIWPDVPATFPAHLYLASAGDLYEVLKQQDSARDTLMLIGHNPGIHGLVQLLSGEGEPALMTKLRGGYNAGSLSILETQCESWDDLLPGGCRLNGLFVGKELS